MTFRPLVRALCAAALLASAARPAAAVWTHNPGSNLPVCTATSDQLSHVVVSDGAGGVIAAWVDLRAGNYDIYAQHVLASGAVDPTWPVNGRALCTNPQNQFLPAIASDGAGGAIVSWHDYRAGQADIYAQRVRSTGVVDPAWPVDGRALCTAGAGQISTKVVADGAGGAIVAWQDFRDVVTYDLYAQHVLANGAVDGAWPVNGRIVCSAPNDQEAIAMISDGGSGAILAWQDSRSGGGTDIYAMHVLGSGVVDPAWTPNGVPLCMAANNQLAPAIVSDGSGGAIVGWHDARSGSYDVYATHVLAAGYTDYTWPLDGRAVCNAANNQTYVAITTDGSGGSLLAWQDFRGPSWDVYVQHLLPNGYPDAAWPANGRALCTATGDQYEPGLLADGSGGALVTWYDFRTSGYDAYVHHILSTGVVDAAWPVDGRAVSIAAQDQVLPRLVSDGAGGAIAVWYDTRSGSPDIYAQRVARFGQLGTPEPVIASVRDVPNDQGGKVKVSWDASWLDTDPSQIVDHYWIFRAVPPNAAAQRIAEGTHASATPGELELAGGALLATPDPAASPFAASTIYWEYLGYQQGYHFLEGYSYLASTASDSVGGNNPRTKFMVVAWNQTQTQYWMSAPDSGYSVDDVGPATPAPFTGEYAGGNTALHWNPNAEPDLAGYRLYRGTSPGFTPGPGNLVAAVEDTGFVDAGGAPFYYKLTAIDVHGNESPPALLLPGGTTDAPFAGAEAVAFAPPAPNPARDRVLLRITLPREGRMSLTIYDVSGARVRTLVAGRSPAGERAIAWDLRNERGARVAAGLYFARLEMEGKTWMHRIAAIE